jgi:Zn ribbon nucleic-acid-binding protein
MDVTMGFMWFVLGISPIAQVSAADTPSDPMSERTCPKCGSEDTTPMRGMSPDENVHYHRCVGCGHVWVTFTDGRKPHHVTPID